MRESTFFFMSLQGFAENFCDESLNEKKFVFYFDEHVLDCVASGLECTMRIHVSLCAYQSVIPAYT